MSDGANLGIDAGRALETILGGKEEPSAEEGLTIEAMREKIYTASLKPESYGDCGWAVARIVCEYLEQHPEDVGLPVEDIYDWERWRVEADQDAELQNPGARLKEYQLAQGLYDRIKERDPERGHQLSGLGLTSFLWGWGYNAAHHVLSLPTGSNPAILEL